MKVTRPQLSKVEYVKALPLFLTRAACLGYGGHTRVSESEAASAANVTARGCVATAIARCYCSSSSSTSGTVEASAEFLLKSACFLGRHKVDSQRTQQCQIVCVLLIHTTAHSSLSSLCLYETHT